MMAPSSQELEPPAIPGRFIPTTELPAFTLITGLNGSGKSHLLQAIVAGKVVTDVTPNYQTDTRLFTWNEMVPQDSGGYSGGQLALERNQLFQQFDAFRVQAAEYIRQPARAAGITGSTLNDVVNIANLSASELIALGHDPQTAEQHFAQIAGGVENASNHIVSQLRNNQPYHDEVLAIAEMSGKKVAALQEEDFKPSKSPSWGKSQPFQQQFSKLFCQYAELVKSNVLNRYYERPALSGEEFQAKFMKAPWDFVNETLQTAGLNFTINQPDKTDNSVFTPKLTKTSTGDEILFGSLSSGEKIIMSFALCMYYAGEGRQLTTYPKLLLLDEVDAPLHPSMSRHFISTITETLVKKLGVNVIATTHSPSTVAIAPNESIHVMRVDQPGVHKTSKAEALNLLTYGVPTLAIDYSGRRQVFVESPIDAELYENLYQLLKSRLGSELSLQFVGVGRENPLTGTHEQAGSTIVAPMVSQLEKSGNLSIFGLLDWDSINTPIGRLHVVGQNERYTLENIILDPLAIAALIVRTTTTKKYLPKLGLSEDTSYVDLLSFTGEKLQALADKVTELLFDEQQRMDIQECKYVGGQSLVLRTIYLHTKGHDLGNLIMDKIPEFKIFKSKLKQEIVGQIFKDKPEFIPIVLIDAFDRLLSAPNHS